MTGLSETRVGLQGIYTSQRQVFAYELLYRSGTANHAQLFGQLDHDRATAQVIGATFGEFGIEELTGGRRLFVNTTRSFVTGELPLPFASEGVVLELLETVEVDDLVIAGLCSLKQRGFEIAVDDFDGELSRLPAVELADYVKIDFEATADRLPQVIDLVREVNPSAIVLVERVETEEQFALCQDLGVDLYQGYLLHRPNVVQRQTLTADHLTCVQLMALLSDPESPVEEVTDLLSGDVGLSMRVLTTVSSAAYAPGGGVTSLQQAVVMLGRQELLGWITLLLLAGDHPGKVPEDVITWIFVRAEACRLLAPKQPDAGFMVGLLSAAAEALGLETSELTRGCRLHPHVRDALLLGAGPLGVVIDAVRTHDTDLLMSGSRSRPVRDPDLGDDSVDTSSAFGSVMGSSPLDRVSHSYLAALTMARSRSRRLMERSN